MGSSRALVKAASPESQGEWCFALNAIRHQSLHERIIRFPLSFGDSLTVFFIHICSDDGIQIFGMNRNRNPPFCPKPKEVNIVARTSDMWIASRG